MIYIKAWGQDIGQLVEHKGIIKFKYSEINKRQNLLILLAIRSIQRKLIKMIR
jgi:hypothetical protein